MSFGADADDPQSELSAFKLRDGFEARLFASETDGVMKPIQMRFDPQGRLWVACSTIYPQLQPGQNPNDKIIVLEDTTGSGRADKVTVFADGLLIPTGLEHGDGGLYVGCGTQLLHLTDKDGDLHADQRRVVLRGFGTGDSHQNINSFCWSPGGQLFMSQGLHAYSDVETPHGIVRLHQAGIMRFTPHELRLEPFFGDGMTPHNPWGFVWDDWFTPFMVAGNGDGIYYLSSCLVSSSHRREFQRIFKPGNKYCGVDLVGTRHLPDELQGKLIAGGFMNNRIVVFRLEDEGSGFSAREEPPLLVSSDVSFRPVDVKVGPDGAIYVADWYNPIIGHYQASFRDPRRDKQHGRIWRITAKDRPLVQKPKLAGTAIPELLDQLKSPERWVRYQARRVLAERAASEVRQSAEKWVAELDPKDSLYERNLVEALGIYELIDTPEPKLLVRLLETKDPRGRAYATEVIGRWHARLSEPLSLLARQAGDLHPRVRLQAVVAVSRIPSERSIEVALTAVDHPMDRFLEDALGQTVFALKEQWLPGLIAGRLAFSDKPQRLEYLLKTDASPDTLQATSDRLNDRNLARATRASLLEVLANAGGAAELALLLYPHSYTDAAGQYDSDLHARLLHRMAANYSLRKLKPAGDLDKSLSPLLGNVALRAEALRLAGKWQLQAHRPVLVAAATSSSESEAIRSAAIEGLGNFRGDDTLKVLSSLSANEQPVKVRCAAIVAQLLSDEKSAAEAAAKLLGDPLDDSLAAELFGAFVLHSKSLNNLADALGRNRPTPDAAKVGLHQMSGLGQANEKLATVLIDAAGFRRERRLMTPAEINSLADEVRKESRADRGALIYARTELNCSACHTIAGKGGTIGPDLSALGTAQPIEFIIGAILYPNREVKEGFTAFEITTKDEEVHQGYILREDAQELVLRDIAAGRDLRFAKSTIVSRRQRGSLMPDGLADTLTHSEFRDLVKYLSTLGRE